MKKLISTLLLSTFSLFADLIFIESFDFDITDTYSFARPGRTGTFYYNLAYFTVDTEGSYRAENTSITSHSTYNYEGTRFNEFDRADTYIYLYKDAFDPTQPTLNLLTQNDDGGQGLLFRLTYNLETNTTYYSVITTYNPDQQMAGDVEISGPSGATIDSTIIPEPAAVALLLSGSVLVLLTRKRDV